jgi:cobalamin biosynthesis protein CobD/CbiB
MALRRRGSTIATHTAPLPLYYTVLPPIALLAYKTINTYLILWGYKWNYLMDGVIKGRHLAIFPNSDGVLE